MVKLKRIIENQELNDFKFTSTSDSSSLLLYQIGI